MDHALVQLFLETDLLKGQPLKIGSIFICGSLKRPASVNMIFKDGLSPKIICPP
jgi:hypothetical protein